jgi:hypothetical protein
VGSNVTGAAGDENGHDIILPNVVLPNIILRDVILRNVVAPNVVPSGRATSPCS